MEKSLETLFRAFTEYKKTTTLDAEAVRFKKSNGTSGGKAKEDIVVYFSTCTINEDWVEAIEEGIPFFEKAIKEERQFIRNEGEVLPIEKVRKTSVSSIQDLARHSNYITHEPDQNAASTVMPDKMLMIQKENDYAVYENRVIYTALVYLRDFVSKRLSMIKELTNKYEASSFYKRKIDFGNRKMNIDFNLHEERLDDPNFVERNAAKSVISRLDSILTSILVLLKQPLMMVVAKSDLVKRPITKTNVLKMNRNFNKSLACFDYIANYQGDGFTIQRIEKSCSPFKPQLLGDMSELVMLQSFITYEYGLGMEGELDKAYQELIKEEKLAKENEIIKRLKGIKLKAQMDEKSLEQYLLDFEEAYRIIEKRLSEVDDVIRDLKSNHKKEVDELKRNHELLVKQMKTEYDNKIEELENANFVKSQELDEEFEKKCTELEQKYNDKEYELTRHYEDLIVELKQQHSDEIAQVRKECEETNIAMKEGCEKDLAEKSVALEEKFAVLTNECNSKVEELTNTTNEKIKENETLSVTKEAYEAEIIALKRQLNRDSVNPCDFVTRDDFVGLEKDRESFLKFFDAAWKEAKLFLRKKHLKIDKNPKNKPVEEQVEPENKEEKVEVEVKAEEPKVEETVKEEKPAVEPKKAPKKAKAKPEEKVEEVKVEETKVEAPVEKPAEEKTEEQPEGDKE